MTKPPISKRVSDECLECLNAQPEENALTLGEHCRRQVSERVVKKDEFSLEHCGTISERQRFHKSEN